MLSCEECAPKRPPRSQKWPVFSFTVKFDTTIGWVSTVMSAKNTISRACGLHSLRVASLTIMTMSRVAKAVAGELVDRHPQHRDRPCARRRADRCRAARPADRQVRRRRLLRALQQLLAVDDLQHAAGAAAIAEIDAVLVDHRDRTMQIGRHRAGRARLLAGQAEVADLHRLRRVLEIVDLGHALGAPAGHGGDEIGNAGLALPPVLVRVADSCRRWKRASPDWPDR